jgi:hypothetical protein
MPAPSSWEFTYARFRETLEAARCSFEVVRLADVPQILRKRRGRAVVLRHDVDLDLRAALSMAEIECEMQVKSTYMVMLNSPLYRLEEPASLAILRELDSMGHEVSLHFDFDDPQHRARAPGYDFVEPRVRSAAARLEDLIGRRIESVSFHRPIPELIGGPLMVAGRVNAYAAELMQWYVSDSRARWRDGDPLPKLRQPAGDLLQLLIHPIWWGREHREDADRLEDFFQQATRGMPSLERQSYSDALASHLPIRRAG